MNNTAPNQNTLAACLVILLLSEIKNYILRILILLLETFKYSKKLKIKTKQNKEKTKQKSHSLLTATTDFNEVYICIRRTDRKLGNCRYARDPEAAGQKPFNWLFTTWMKIRSSSPKKRPYSGLCIVLLLNKQF